MTIEFELPTWEEWQQEMHTSKNVSEKTFLIFGASIIVARVCYPYNEKEFELTEQGYTLACQWLNQKKLELCKQLAR